MRSFATSVRRSIGVACLLTLAFAGFGAQPASAHNALSTSNPANGAVLTQSPATWSLTFTKDVPLDSATAEFIASNGVRTALPAPTYGANQKEILFALPPDLNGAITARWRLVGTDGHVVTERVSFTVNIASVAVESTTTTLAGATTSVDAVAQDAAVYRLKSL